MAAIFYLALSAIQLFVGQQELSPFSPERGDAAICPLDVAVVSFEVDAGSNVQGSID